MRDGPTFFHRVLSPAVLGVGLIIIMITLSGCGEEDTGICAPQSVEIEGTGCTSRWLGCQGSDFVITCTRESAAASHQCSCTQNTVAIGSFTSVGYCAQPLDAMTLSANTGCGWAIRIE